MNAFPSATSLEVRASVHVWHAINVNEVEIHAPDMIPRADWEEFSFVVDLDDGIIHDWLIGEASLTLEIDKASEYYLLNRSGDRVATWNPYEIIPMLKPRDGPFDFADKEKARERCISLAIGAEGSIAGWPSSYERDQMISAGWTATASWDPDARIGIDSI